MTRAAQGEVFERPQRDGGIGPAEVEPGQGVFQQAEQGVRIQRLVDEADGEVDQPAGVHARQGLAGRDVGDHPPTLQPACHAPAQRQIGGDEGAGLARSFQRLAHHQGEGGGGVLLGPDGDDGQAFQPLGDGIGGLFAEGVGAQGPDHAAPVVGGVGGAQGFVDQPLAGATARFRHRVLRRFEPGPDGLAFRAAVQKSPQGVLRVLFVVADGGPDRRIQFAVEARQDDAAARGGGDGGQHIGGGGGGAGRAGGDHGLGRRPIGPGHGQKAQQAGATPGRIDQSHGFQPLRPGLDGEGEEFGGLPPVLGQILLDESRDPMQVLDLFQLAGVEEAAEGVRHLQRAQGRQAGTEILDDHPRHLEPTGQRGDGRGQVETEFAGREGRFVFFKIAQRPDLRQQDGAAAGLFRQGGGEGPRGPAVGQQDDGVGQGLGRMVAEPVEHAGGEILKEGATRLDRVPARTCRLERIEAGGHVPASLASAASRASGSPTCIQSPSSTQPYSRPAAAERRQKPLSEKGPSGPSAT